MSIPCRTLIIHCDESMKYRFNTKIKFTTTTALKKYSLSVRGVQFTQNNYMYIPERGKVCCYAVMFTHDIRSVVNVFKAAAAHVFAAHPFLVVISPKRQFY